MRSVFSWNRQGSDLDVSLGFNKALQLYAAEASARFMNPYVPFYKGNLSENYETGLDGNNGYVKYSQVYAHKMYNGVGFNFSQEQHPLATHHWDEAMMLVHDDQLAKEIDHVRKRFAF